MTVVESIELPGYPENMGAQIVHEMASKTSEVAGAAGLNPMDLKPGIDMAVTAVVACSTGCGIITINGL